MPGGRPPEETTMKNKAPEFDLANHGSVGIARGQGFALHAYKTEHAFADVLTEGYFDKAEDIYRPGDHIALNCFTFGALSASATLVCTANEGGKVSVASMGAWFAPADEREEAA